MKEWTSFAIVCSVLAVSLAPGRAAHAQSLPWTYAAMGNGSREVDAKRDASGRAHVSYHDASDGKLKYVYRSGSGFETEIIATNALGPHAIDLDPQGRPCVVYVLRSPASGLVCATRTGQGQWSPEVVTTVSAANPDFDINPAGKAAVSFENLTADRLQYVEKSPGGAWSSPLTPDNTTLNGASNALVLTASGDPRIVYSEVTRLKFVERVGSQWQSPITLDNHVPPTMDIALTSSEALRVVSLAIDGFDGFVLYFERNGASWSSASTLESVGASTVPVACRIAVDAGNLSHVSYYHVGTHDMKYAAQGSNGEWTTYIVETFLNPRNGSALALDASGYPLIVYSKPSSTGLTFAHAGIELYGPNGGESYLQGETPILFWGGIGTFDVQASEDGLNWSPLANGIIGNSAYNSTPSISAPAYMSALCKFRITRASPAGVAASASPFRIGPGQNRPWTSGTVESTNDVGNRPSIATDGTVVGISYYDATNGNLKFAVRCLDGPWSIETVQAAGDVGVQSSLKIVNGTAYLAYTDWTTNQVKVAVRTGGSWGSPQPVYTAASDPLSPSLAVQSNGTMHLSFWADHQIRYGYKSGANWNTEVVGDAPLAGDCSISLTSSNAPRIAYSSPWWSTPHTGPRYASRTGVIPWPYETTNDANATGYGIALAHDGADLPRISYVDIHLANSKRVRLAARLSGGGWSTSTFGITGSPEIGFFTSLAVDALGQSYLLYSSKKMFLYHGPGNPSGVGYSDLGSTTSIASIALMPQGRPLIAAYDQQSGNLVSIMDAPDLVPPASVGDLSANLGKYGGTLHWSDTGDDGMTCDATWFEVRQSSTAIDGEAAWSAATLILDGVPGTPGTGHCWEVSMSPCATNWFAVRMRDNANQWSGIAAISASAPCTGNTMPVCDGGFRATESQLEAGLPLTLDLSRVMPNPVRDQATLRLGIPGTAVGERVDAAVFDVLGRRTATLHSGVMKAGWHTLSWDRRRSSGTVAEPGVYFIRVSVGNENRVRSVLLLGE